MEKEVLSRQELYDLVWAKPINTLSKKYQISDGGIRKICVQLNIPLPKAGHWQRIQHNKRVQVKPLPSEYSGNDRVELILRTPETEDKALPATSSTPTHHTVKKDQKSKSLGKVPSKLTNPDPLIISAKESLSKGKGRYYEHGGLVWTSNGQLDIRVAPASVDRALRLMDTLIKLLRSRNHRIEVTGGYTFVIIYEQKIEIFLKELMMQTYEPFGHDTSWTRRVYKPTGRFSLWVGRYPTKEWKDGNQLLEDQLLNILAKFEAIAQSKKAEQIEREIRYQENQERLRIQKELQAQKEKELAALKELLSQAQQWQQAKALREYIEAVEEKAINNDSLTDALLTWIAWARQKADTIDPITGILYPVKL